MKKKYFSLQLISGTPTPIEHMATAITIMNVACFWYRDAAHFYIIEKSTGLAFSDTCTTFAAAKLDVRIKIMEKDLQQAINQAKEKYPEINFPLNK